MDALIKFLVAAVLVTVVIIGAALLFAFPTEWLWNWLMPALFHLPTIDVWQALGINALSSILFKSNHSFQRQEVVDIEAELAEIVQTMSAVRQRIDNLLAVMQKPAPRRPCTHRTFRSAPQVAQQVEVCTSTIRCRHCLAVFQGFWDEEDRIALCPKCGKETGISLV